MNKTVRTLVSENKNVVTKETNQLKILSFLSEINLQLPGFNEVVDRTGLARAAVWSHIKDFIDKGEIEKVGKKYRISEKGIAKLDSLKNKRKFYDIPVTELIPLKGPVIQTKKPETKPWQTASTASFYMQRGASLGQEEKEAIKDEIKKTIIPKISSVLENHPGCRGFKIIIGAIPERKKTRSS